MNLDDLIIDNSGNWVIKGRFLMYKKYVYIPICFIEDDVYYIFLNLKIYNQVLKLTRHLVKLDVEFYFTTPEYSNPKTEIDDNLVIYHYLFSYSRPQFFFGFTKIDFDLMNNFTKWMEKEKCFHLFKENYDTILKKIVNRSWYDYYTNTHIYDCELEIRENFAILYRDIQILRLI